MDWYMIAKERYPKSWMTLSQLDRILQLGWINQEQYNEIIAL